MDAVSIWDAVPKNYLNELIIYGPFFAGAAYYAMKFLYRLIYGDSAFLGHNHAPMRLWMATAGAVALLASAMGFFIMLQTTGGLLIVLAPMFMNGTVSDPDPRR